MQLLQFLIFFFLQMEMVIAGLWCDDMKILYQKWVSLSRKRTKRHTFATIEALIMYHLNANAKPLARVHVCVWLGQAQDLRLLGLKVWVGETGVKRWDKKR